MATPSPSCPKDQWDGVGHRCLLGGGALGLLPEFLFSSGTLLKRQKETEATSVGQACLFNVLTQSPPHPSGGQCLCSTHFTDEHIEAQGGSVVSDGTRTLMPVSLLCCPSQFLRLLSLLLGPQLQLFLLGTPFPHPMGPVCARMQWCVYPYLHKEDSLRCLSLATCGPPTPSLLPGLICTGQFGGLCWP